MRSTTRPCRTVIRAAGAWCSVTFRFQQKDNQIMGHQIVFAFRTLGAQLETVPGLNTSSLSGREMIMHQPKARHTDRQTLEYQTKDTQTDRQTDMTISDERKTRRYRERGCSISRKIERHSDRHFSIRRKRDTQIQKETLQHQPTDTQRDRHFSTSLQTDA